MAGSTAASVLELYPGGYPVHIELAQQDVGGVATAMRFDLPLRGHNSPLTHRFERKLVLELRSALQIRRDHSSRSCSWGHSPRCRMHSRQVCSSICRIAYAGRHVSLA